MDTTCTGDNAESPPRDVFGIAYQLRRAKAREKEYGGHQIVSIADIQVVGLPFEDSKKYRLGEVVSVKVRTGNLNWFICNCKMDGLITLDSTVIH